MANVKLLALDPAYGVPTEIGSTDVAVLGKAQILGVNGVAIDAGGNIITNVAQPQSASDVATKGYADAISQGITQVASVRAMANSQQNLTGLPTVDGVSLVAGDRVLLTGQTANPVQNGVWVVSSGSWSRPTGANGISDWTSGRPASGLAMFVREGSAFADQGYVCITDGNPIIDTSPVAFTQYTGLGEVVAGDGLQKQAASGNQIAVLLASASGLQITGGALDHLLDPAGALGKSTAGVTIKPNANATVAVDAQGLRTLGLPSLFTVSGVAVDANVTAPNLNTLVDGKSSLADSLHQHQSVLEALATVATHKNGGTALSAGDPVQWSSTADTLQRCDASAIAKAQVIGVAQAAVAANALGKIVRRGVAAGVLTNATPGAPVYLNAGGGLTPTLTTAFNGNVVRVGWAKNATDLDVQPQTLAQRAPS